jgi:MFS family permease
MGFIMFGSLLWGFSLLRTRLPPRKSGPFFDLESFKDPAYTLFVLGLSLAFMAYFIPFFYIEPFSLRVGTSENLSFYMLVIMNAAGTLGRMFPNFLADRYELNLFKQCSVTNRFRIGNLNVIVSISYVSGLILLLWLTVHHTDNLIAISVIYSFFAGGLTNCAPAVVGLLSPELNKIGTRVGMMYTIVSLGTLIGTPIAGAILKRQNPTNSISEANYEGVFIFAGVAMLAASVCMHYTRIDKKGVLYFGKV